MNNFESSQHSRTRIQVERALGLLKAKFKIFRAPLMGELKTMRALADEAYMEMDHDDTVERQVDEVAGSQVEVCAREGEILSPVHCLL
jgi:hypothetical protein